MQLKLSIVLALLIICSSFNTYLNYKKEIRVAEIHTQSDEALMLSLDSYTKNIKALKDSQTEAIKAVEELNLKMKQVYIHLKVKDKIDID